MNASMPVDPARRARIARALCAVLAGAMLAAVALFVMWLRHEIAIDRCLDLGGRWNQQQDACEGRQAARMGAYNIIVKKTE